MPSFLTKRTTAEPYRHGGNSGSVPPPATVTLVPLSLYFKNPTVRNGRQVHELFAQRQMWENEIRRLAGWTVNGRAI